MTSAMQSFSYGTASGEEINQEVPFDTNKSNLISGAENYALDQSSAYKENNGQISNNI